MQNHRTPLKKVKNFGPVTLGEFESMGILFFDQIEKLGFEETCRLWVQYYPERLNANAFLGIACALDKIVWTCATPEHRQLSHKMVSTLKSELGLPITKKRGPRP